MAGAFGEDVADMSINDIEEELPEDEVALPEHILVQERDDGEAIVLLLLADVPEPLDAEDSPARGGAACQKRCSATLAVRGSAIRVPR